MMLTKFRDSLKGIGEIIILIWNEASAFVKVRLALVLLLVLITAVLTPLGPLALKLIIDRFTGSTEGSLLPLAVLVSLYVLSQWMARCMGELRGLVYARAERRIARTMSERLFAHIMRLPLRFHLNRQTGAISQVLDNGLRGFQMILHQLVFTMLPVFAQLATVAVVLLHFNQPAFLAIFLLAVLCYGIAFAISAMRVATAARASATASIDASAVMTDSILNYETIKFFDAEAMMQAKVSRAFVQTENEAVTFYRRYALNGIAVASVFAAFLALSVAYSIHEVLAGRMAIGDFVLVNTYMLQIMVPVEMLGFALQAFSQGAAMLERVLELLHEQTEPWQRRRAKTPPGGGNLEFEHVSLSYGARAAVLDDVSFALRAGKTLGVVGASGAGKSTIVRLMVRLLEPSAGRICLDGAPLPDLMLSDVRRAIAVVPQDTLLFNDTIGYNIAFGRPGSTHEEVEAAARQARIHDFITSLPDGYETQVGERGVKLSGGEKQRLSIARAVLKTPRIYVFDEATSSLDSKTEREILQSLQEVSRSKTTLIITHRLSTVVHADEIVVLERGKVVERGTHEALLLREGHYAGLWRAQQTEDPRVDKLSA